MEHASKFPHTPRLANFKRIMEKITTVDKDLPAVGLLVVAYVLEGFPRDITSKTECSSLLNKMVILAKKVVILAKKVKDFNEGHPLMREMQDNIKAATELIVGGYIMCCVLLKPPSFFKFFPRSTKNKALHNIEKEIDKMCSNINNLNERPWSSFVDFDLDGLSKHIDQLFRDITNQNSEESPHLQLPPGSLGRVFRSLSSSEGLKKLKEFLSPGVDCVSALGKLIINKDVTKCLDLIEGVSIATKVFGVLAYVLKKVEETSENNEECSSLLKEMFFLGKLLMQLEENPKGMRGLINEGKVLIKSSAETCLHQIKDDGIMSKFCSSSQNKSELAKVQKKLDNMYKKINTQMGVRLLHVLECKEKPRLSRGYPDHAVGIDDSVKEVMDLLEWGSNKEAVGVIIYGFGGLGKTTLADAVFSRVHFHGCQYSMVQLLEKTDSTPKIVELQKMILQDLMGSKDIPEIRKQEDGQRELVRLLEQVPALIYIDNVLDEHTLRQLLPVNLDKAKKLRLLITARHKTVGRACPVKTVPKGYRMTNMSATAAMSLLRNELSDDRKGKLNSDQVDHIIDICGGVPLMLKLAAGALRFEEDEHKVCKVIEELQKMEGETFGNNIEPYIFAYDNLPEACKDAFLDICSPFFEGWGWDRVADIVGKSELQMLEHRALVGKGTNGVETVATVPNVILKMARKKTKRMEFRFITASQSMDFLHEKDERIQQLRYLSYKPSKDLNQTIEMPSKLKYLEIDGKLQSDDLEIIPEKLLDLPDLRVLKLINFEGLKTLPRELGKEKKSLRELALSNCKSLEKLPSSTPKLESLRVLRMDGCASVKVLPHGLGKLTSLIELDLSNCQNLTELPEDFKLLNSLQILNLKQCEKLTVLPDGFENLLSLRVLNLSSCKALRNLPSGLGKLTSLVELDILRCSNLVSISESIGDLKSLPSIDLSECSHLKELPNEFHNLCITYLNLTGCVQLKKLPDQFGELKSLRALKLTSCTQLQGLPESFSQLKNLVHLDLSGCSALKKLGRNFHVLASLQHFHLRDCPQLEREAMDSIRMIEKLEMVFITNGGLLDKLGESTQKQPCCFQLYRGKDLSSEEKESLLQKLPPKLNSLLKDGQEKPIHICDRPLNTSVLVMFDARQNFSHTDFPWLLLEDTIEDLQNFEMIYIGKHFNKLPPRVAHKIVGHAPDSLNARLLFEKVFSTLESDGKSDGVKLWHRKANSYFSMTAKIVGGKYVSWNFLSDCQTENYLFSRCGRYLKLKQLATEEPVSSIHLLKELFLNGRDENCLLRQNKVNGGIQSDEVVVDELQGKEILLDVRPASARSDNRLQFLSELYSKREKELNLEIISIPIGQLSNGFEQFCSTSVPWLVLQNPLAGRAVNYFLIEKCQWEAEKSSRSESWYPSRIMKIEPNGKITAHQPLLSMLERWGPERYPFRDVKKLRKQEWDELKGMSSLEFLFKPLKGEVNKEGKQLKPQGKSICLLCDGKDPDTGKGRIKTFVSSIKKALADVMDSIHFIYVPFYDDEKKKEKLPATDSISMLYFPLEESKMPQDKNGWSLPEWAPKYMKGLSLPEWAAMRFWRRAWDLQKEINGNENDQKIIGINEKDKKRM